MSLAAAQQDRPAPWMRNYAESRRFCWKQPILPGEPPAQRPRSFTAECVISNKPSRKPIFRNTTSLCEPCTNVSA